MKFGHMLDLLQGEAMQTFSGFGICIEVCYRRIASWIGEGEFGGRGQDSRMVWLKTIASETIP